MKRAVRRALLLSALAAPSALYALGLGEIRLNSALNQPFDAEIELVSAAPEDLAALRASLAREAFQRYGLKDRLPVGLPRGAFGGRDVLKLRRPSRSRSRSSPCWWRRASPAACCRLHRAARPPFAIG
jgi:hypothetical protein